LNRLVGRDPIEIGKTLLLAFLAVMLAIALQQLTAARSQVTVGAADREQVLSLARDFGQALTTYDYAHPEVQANHLASLATAGVVARVRQSWPDLVQAQAASIGQVPDAYVQELDADRGSVLLRTHSLGQSRFTAPGTSSSGLLLCTVQKTGSGWRVVDYQWLTAAANGVS
jgi:hypothetical protein